MQDDALRQAVERYSRALARLHQACRQPEDEFVRDAVIQRFEFTWELAWKLLRRKLLSEGIEAGTPRQAIRAAVEGGLLTDGNLWTELMRMRNLTSHTYDEALARQVYAFVCRHALPALDALRQRAASW